MFVDPKIAVTKSILGTSYYFCDEECADKFEKETSVGTRAESPVSTVK